ncbi:MAG: septum formation protein Maf [Zetaproteobacteria bacterium]|nr:septum formation protein Maf [Zetaproteobacteria bacterium]
MTNLILASQSPRRLELLQAAGISVKVSPAHINESAHDGENVQDLVLRLCQEKAAACPDKNYENIIIAADTLVTLGGTILGQPKNFADAKSMLQTLSGKRHQVLTAVCVAHGEQQKTAVVQTYVTFRTISEDEIDTYLAHNQILDKAGSYAIQGGASSFITHIEGPLDNVIGLPVQQTLALIQQLERSHEC